MGVRAGSVFATQGGGYATENRHREVVWVEPPKEFPEFVMGQRIPEEWDLILIGTNKMTDRDFEFSLREKASKLF